MYYLLHTNMSPFVGRSFVEDPTSLVSALDSISAKVVSGVARAGARKAEVLVAAETHRELMLMTIPWCIVTGEHPPVEPVLRGAQLGKMELFSSVFPEGLHRAKEEHGRHPHFLVTLRGQDLSAKGMREGLELLSGSVVESYYSLDNDKVRMVVETAEPEVLARALSPLRRAGSQELTVEPVVEWNAFLDTLRGLGGISSAPSEAPAGCCDSPCCKEEIRPFTMPRGGTDRLQFTTWDTIEIPGMGEREIRLDGHYQIERRHPTSGNWVDAEVEIEMKEMEVKGKDELLGDVRAFLRREPGTRNWGRVAHGTLHDDRSDGAKHCKMNANVAFEVGRLGMTVVSKEPIALTHSITHIPPVGQGGGTGAVRIPLYDVKRMDGEPVAFLKRVHTHIGDFVEPSPSRSHSG